MGANNSKNAAYGNRHCKSSSRGGCPDAALIWVGEGNMAITKNKDQLFLYYGDYDCYGNHAAALAQHKIDNDTWDAIIKRLQDKHGIISKKALKKEIEAINSEVFDEQGLIAVYGEYGPKGGQACMCVYKKAAFEQLRDGKQFEVNCGTN